MAMSYRQLLDFRLPFIRNVQVIQAIGERRSVFERRALRVIVGSVNIEGD